MSDPLQKVRSGDPLTIPAQAYNAFIDAARDYQQRRQSIARRDASHEPSASHILIRNESGSDRQRFDVLGLGEPIFSPQDGPQAEQSFRNQIAFRGELPDQTKHQNRLAILQQPLKAGAMGRACVSGVTVAKLRLDGSAGALSYAQIIHGDASALQPSVNGSVAILWPPVPPLSPLISSQGSSGDSLAIVRLGSVAASPTVTVRITGYESTPGDYTAEITPSYQASLPSLARATLPDEAAHGTHTLHIGTYRSGTVIGQEDGPNGPRQVVLLLPAWPALYSAWAKITGDGPATGLYHGTTTTLQTYYPDENTIPGNQPDSWTTPAIIVNLAENDGAERLLGAGSLVQGTIIGATDAQAGDGQTIIAVYASAKPDYHGDDRWIEIVQPSPGDQEYDPDHPSRQIIRHIGPDAESQVEVNTLTAQRTGPDQYQLQIVNWKVDDCGHVQSLTGKGIANLNLDGQWLQWQPVDGGLPGESKIIFTGPQATVDTIDPITAAVVDISGTVTLRISCRELAFDDKGLFTWDGSWVNHDVPIPGLSDRWVAVNTADQNPGDLWSKLSVGSHLVKSVHGENGLTLRLDHAPVGSTGPVYLASVTGQTLSIHPIQVDGYGHVASTVGGGPVQVAIPADQTAWIQTHENWLLSLQNTLDGLTAQVNTIQSAVDTHASSINTLNQAVDTLEQVIATLATQNAVDALTTRIIALEQMLASFGSSSVPTSFTIACNGDGTFTVTPGGAVTVVTRS